MPLVVFNYNSHPGIETIDHREDTVLLREVPPPNSRWFLRSVQALYYHDDKEDFRTFEIEVPSLFQNDRVRFANSAEGNASVPENTLRFYVNNLKSGGTQHLDSVFKSVSLHPNLNMGRHSLTSSLFKIVVTARNGNGAREPVKLAGYSVVFEYE